jgi:hypothetical protein
MARLARARLPMAPFRSGSSPRDFGKTHAGNVRAIFVPLALDCHANDHCPVIDKGSPTLATFVLFISCNVRVKS